MSNRVMAIAILLSIMAQPILAQTLIPATSEDINDFDRQVSQQLQRSKDSKAKPKAENFGAKVSEEAKKLKDAGADKGKEFGKWVSGQRKKADQGRPSAQGSVGAENAAGHAPAPHGPPDGKGNKKK